VIVGTGSGSILTMVGLAARPPVPVSPAPF